MQFAVIQAEMHSIITSQIWTGFPCEWPSMFQTTRTDLGAAQQL